MSQEPDYYSCKQMLFFKDIYDQFFASLSKGNKAEFEKKCKNALKKLEKSNAGEFNSRQCDVVITCKQVLKEIVDEIQRQKTTSCPSK